MLKVRYAAKPVQASLVCDRVISDTHWVQYQEQCSNRTASSSIDADMLSGKCDVKTELPGGGDARVTVTGAAGDWMDKSRGATDTHLNRR